MVLSWKRYGTRRLATREAEEAITAGIGARTAAKREGRM
jgi:hypothetical protein